jgi:hypothetical protein
MLAQSGQSLFIGVMGAPYESELFTTLVRMVDQALVAGHDVTVWTCGGATTLTLKCLGDAKPGNPLEIAAEHRGEYPSPAAVVRALLETSQGRLQWLVCRHCTEERGGGEHMDGVKIQPAFRFLRHLNGARTSLVIGVK